jgi:acyl carrier protein
MRKAGKTMSTQAGILKVIHAVADIPNDPAPDESLFDSGTLDSFTLPDLVTGLEQEFNVKIPDADLVPERFDTVTKIEAYLDSRKD